MVSEMKLGRERDSDRENKIMLMTDNELSYFECIPIEYK
jgi:hypothetical protein